MLPQQFSYGDISSIRNTIFDSDGNLVESDMELSLSLDSSLRKSTLKDKSVKQIFGEENKSDV